MKYIKKLLIAGLIVFAGALTPVLTSQPVYAGLDCAGADKNTPTCAANRGIDATGAQNKSCGTNGNQTCTLGDTIKTVINVLLFIVGSISVIMIIVGGIRYVLSNGDSSQIKSAKDAIMYAVIGLIVSLLAYAIVNFVVTQFA